MVGTSARSPPTKSLRMCMRMCRHRHPSLRDLVRGNMTRSAVGAMDEVVGESCASPMEREDEQETKTIVGNEAVEVVFSRERMGERARHGDTVNVVAFEEVCADDLDSLDITASQDFQGDDSGSPVTSRTRTACSPKPMIRPWTEYRDGTQLIEEDSEVFDDALQTPRPLHRKVTQPATPMFGGHGAEKAAAASTFATSRKAPARSSTCETEDAELSDGFEVMDTLISSPLQSPTATSPLLPSGPLGSNMSAQASSLRQSGWKQRLSVKRDATFIEDSDASIDSPRCSVETGLQELLDPNQDFSSRLRLEDAPASTVPSTSAQDEAQETNVPPTRHFPKRRRKVRQLGLERFFEFRPCAWSS